MFQRVIVSLFVASFALFGATQARAADDQEARTFIEGLAQKAITTVAAQNISDADRKAQFQRLFISAFDIPEIGEFVLSRHWKTATPAQQKDFLVVFEDMQVLTWSQRFKHYDGVKLETEGAKMESEGVWLVDSQIVRPQGPPTPVQWRIRRAADGSMRIIDIIAEGVSMALTYRDEYAAALQSNSGNIDALLTSMRAKNVLLAGPAEKG
jgi:phospholipid transport system substrate-binding protein